MPVCPALQKIYFLKEKKSYFLLSFSDNKELLQTFNIFVSVHFSVSLFVRLIVYLPFFSIVASTFLYALVCKFNKIFLAKLLCVKFFLLYCIIYLFCVSYFFCPLFVCLIFYLPFFLKLRGRFMCFCMQIFV